MFLVAKTRPEDPDHAGMPWDMAHLDASLPRLAASRGIHVYPVSLDTSEGILVRGNRHRRHVVPREDLAIARELGAEALEAFTCGILDHLYASGV